MSRGFTTASTGQTAFQGMPWEFDPLEQDLNLRFQGFPTGTPIAWGLAHEAVTNSWTDEAMISGLDWQGRFFPPKGLKVPRARPQRFQQINACTFLLLVSTGETDMNTARDVGRRRCRALLGLVRREYPTIQMDKLVWEGAVVWPQKNKMVMTVASGDYATQASKTSRILHQVGRRLAKVEVSRFPPQLLQSLEWLALARSARVRTEKFVHLWLAALALASYGVGRRKADMRRIRDYAMTMTSGIAGVRSALAVQDLVLRFRRAYLARNQLVHAADSSLITIDLLVDLELAVFELIDFEMAKLKMNIIES